jgi:ribosomal protein S18 acetylase RimI-like enzyme
MEYIRVTDRDQIEKYLNKHPGLFVYSLGDLEDDIWPYTTWFGAVEGGEIKAICMVFSKYDPPLVQAISESGNCAINGLISAIVGYLPGQARVHFGSATNQIFASEFEIADLVSGWKMALSDPSNLAEIDISRVERLGHDDVESLERLYESAHGESEGSHLFSASMLDIGPHFGLRNDNDGQLVSAAGVHVYSPRFGVAAVANVATRTDMRGRGLAQSVTARLCLELGAQVDHIGLNVEGHNEPALQAYKKIGFGLLAEFYAADMTRIT